MEKLVGFWRVKMEEFGRKVEKKENKVIMSENLISEKS